jgi:hypothetical protein
MIAIHKHKKEYFPFYNIGKELAMSAKRTIPEMTDEIFIFILQNYNKLAKEWCKEKGKKYNQWHQQRAKETLINEIKKNFKQWESTQHQ